MTTRFTQPQHIDDSHPEREGYEYAQHVVILKNDFDEYQVPDDGDFYYTDDRDDAIGTACAIYGANVKVTFRRVH